MALRFFSSVVFTPLSENISDTCHLFLCLACIFSLPDLTRLPSATMSVRKKPAKTGSVRAKVFRRYSSAAAVSRRPFCYTFLWYSFYRFVTGYCRPPPPHRIYTLSNSQEYSIPSSNTQFIVSATLQHFQLSSFQLASLKLRARQHDRFYIRCIPA